ncbi:TlpA disulfide reductase family protein [uncultured Clostridium sp.]|uniref:TlpA family protein disulfide reductase n=1 Tax=uncultured Clostridium sp. TaxID=59620 RepID=UPI0025F3CD54|nr:TlpA disulfide reductase family protein [uncultured Clostridium sp.]
MIKRKKFVIISIVFGLITILGITAYVSDKKERNIKKTLDMKLVSENINDIPPEILDDVAPNIKQNFKAKAKDFEFHDKDENEYSFSSYEGQNVVLNFWSSTCEKCTTQLSFFEEVSKKYEGKVSFLMINVGDNNEFELKYLKDNNISLETFFDNHYDARVNYKVDSLPRTIFIDKSGTIQDDVKFEISKEVLEEKIENFYMKGDDKDGNYSIEQ